MIRFGNGLVWQCYIGGIMQDSPFYELIKERGARETNIKNILTVLSERFPQSSLQRVEQALDAIPELERLEELHRVAVKSPSVEVFLQEIDETE